MRYHHIEVRVNSKAVPSVALISSTIRGTYGYFLKSQVCVESSYDCKECAFAQTCLYYRFYNKDGNAPPPFRIDVALDNNDNSIVT